MRNNSLAMLATVTGVAILAWWIGYFDPATCKQDIQQAGWTSCESIAEAQNQALFVFVTVTAAATTVVAIRSFFKRRTENKASARRLTTR